MPYGPNLTDSAVVILHTGSNLGKRLKNLCLANYFIEREIGLITISSSVYETEAWGKTSQNLFLNQALVVETQLEPVDILNVIHRIEKDMGRIRFEKWGARIIDIDILFYNDQIIKKDNIKIPHPEITNRNFVLVPLNEIMPDYIHPSQSKPISLLLEECKDQCAVRQYKDE